MLTGPTQAVGDVNANRAWHDDGENQRLEDVLGHAAIGYHGTPLAQALSFQPSAFSFSRGFPAPPTNLRARREES
jgi:hypothetical protein